MGNTPMTLHENWEVRQNVHKTGTPMDCVEYQWARTDQEPGIKRVCHLVWIGMKKIGIRSFTVPVELSTGMNSL